MKFYYDSDREAWVVGNQIRAIPGTIKLLLVNNLLHFYDVATNCECYAPGWDVTDIEKNATGGKYATIAEFDNATKDFFVDASVSMMGAIIEKLYPVGHILTTEKADNPATYLGVGTWSAYGSGRALVGVDTAQTEFNTVAKTGGAKTHTLTETQIPSHKHTMNVDFKNEFGVAQAGAKNQAGTGDSTEIASVWDTNNTGGGQSHNNLQPYICVYMWKRTA